MKSSFIVNHPPYGTEHAFNALRLGDGLERATLDDLADWTAAADELLVF